MATGTGNLGIFKNVGVLSFAFLLLFTAFQSVQNLQSSINSEAGLGLASLSVIYASLVLSCMFLPAWLISLLGCKRCIVLAIACYGIYMLANFYSHWGTLIPASVLLGTAAAPLWISKCTYLTEMASEYSKNNQKRKDATTALFFGIFFMAFQSSQVWGNLISSQVLGQGLEQQHNRSLSIIAECCGSKYCGSSEELACTGQYNVTKGLIERPSQEKIYTLFGVYAGCAFLAALLVAIILDPLEEAPVERGGLEQGFIGGDYTKAFVSCSWGVHQVGYVMITFGVCNALFSFLWGKISNFVGRIPLYYTAALLNITSMIVMLWWKPNPETESYIFFILAGMWGVADAVWQVLINALYGVLFSENEAAGFSNYRLWESLGFIIAYAYADYLCLSVKIYILISVLILGMITYTYIDTKYTYFGKERRHNQ